jgi:hypothetical protein
MTDGQVLRAGRDSPLPEPMQGRWIVDEEPLSELRIAGGEIDCFGAPVDYDYKEIASIDGALSVELHANDSGDEDSFQRANITGLVITPEGDFLGYNAKSGYRFVRAADEGKAG